jgi:transcriptional regulator with XRE-family HTH domain
MLFQFLKQQRVKAGLTRNDVAKKLGYTSSKEILAWESGSASPPVFQLKQISDMYKADEVTLKRYYFHFRRTKYNGALHDR